MLRTKLAAGLVVVLFAGAGCRVERNPAFDLAVEFARVEQAHSRLDAAAAELARCTREEEAVGRPRDARRADVLHRAQKNFESSWVGAQRVTAAFLSRALELAPTAPQTARALERVAQDAVEVAALVRTTTGDDRAALQLLRAAERTFVSAGRPIPAELARALAEAAAHGSHPH